MRNPAETLSAASGSGVCPWEAARGSPDRDGSPSRTAMTGGDFRQFHSTGSAPAMPNWRPIASRRVQFEPTWPAMPRRRVGDGDAGDFTPRPAFLLPDLAPPQQNAAINSRRAPTSTLGPEQPLCLPWAVPRERTRPERDVLAERYRPRKAGAHEAADVGRRLRFDVKPGQRTLGPTSCASARWLKIVRLSFPLAPMANGMPS